MSELEFESNERFEPVLPPRLTLMRDVADVVKELKAPFFGEWGIDDKAIRIIEDIGYLAFDGFNQPDQDNNSCNTNTTLLGADNVGLSDLVASGNEAFVINIMPFVGDKHLNLDPWMEGVQHDEIREHIIFIAPDIPPTAVFADFIDDEYGNHIAQLSDAVAKYGQGVLHQLSDEDCVELIRLLRMAQIDKDEFRGVFEDRVISHWDKH